MVQLGHIGRLQSTAAPSFVAFSLISDSPFQLVVGPSSFDLRGYKRPLPQASWRATFSLASYSGRVSCGFLIIHPRGAWLDIINTSAACELGG